MAPMHTRSTDPLSTGYRKSSKSSLPWFWIAIGSITGLILALIVILGLLVNLSTIRDLLGIEGPLVGALETAVADCTRRLPPGQYCHLKLHAIPDEVPEPPPGLYPNRRFIDPKATSHYTL